MIQGAKIIGTSLIGAGVGIGVAVMQLNPRSGVVDLPHSRVRTLNFRLLRGGIWPKLITPYCKLPLFVSGLSISYYSTTSSPPSLTDDEITPSNKGDSVNDTPEDLANRYAGDYSGLHAREEKFRGEISATYVQKVKDLEQKGLESGFTRQDLLQTAEYKAERESLGRERDKSFKDLSDLQKAGWDIIKSREPETDYDDWTTRANSPADEGDSTVDEDNEFPSPSSETNIGKPSSSKRSLDDAEAGESSNDSANKRQKTDNSSCSTDHESSSKSASTSESRKFKQDSSDVMPDSEPLDFDDPTG